MAQTGRDLIIALIGRDCVLELTWKQNKNKKQTLFNC